jgi:hypothetical protein
MFFSSGNHVVLDCPEGISLILLKITKFHSKSSLSLISPILIPKGKPPDVNPAMNSKSPIK